MKILNVNGVALAFNCSKSTASRMVKFWEKNSGLKPLNIYGPKRYKWEDINKCMERKKDL